MADFDAGAQYPNGCCDYGWVHLCGGPHGTALVEEQVPMLDPATGEPTGETQTALVSVLPDGHVAPLPDDQGGCQTVRCAAHCSCFAPDGVHATACALAAMGG